MGIIDNKIKELIQLKKEVPKQAEIIARKYKKEILDYIREKQLFEQGIDGKGKKLKKYKPFTIAIKKQKGEVYNRTTLLDTGSFYNKMDLIFTDQNAIGIFSRDEKTPDLLQKYGQNVLILTVKNQKEVDSKIFEENIIKWLLNTKAFTKI